MDAELRFTDGQGEKQTSACGRGPRRLAAHTPVSLLREDPWRVCGRPLGVTGRPPRRDSPPPNPSVEFPPPERCCILPGPARTGCRDGGRAPGIPDSEAAGGRAGTLLTQADLGGEGECARARGRNPTTRDRGRTWKPLRLAHPALEPLCPSFMGRSRTQPTDLALTSTGNTITPPQPLMARLHATDTRPTRGPRGGHRPRLS